MQTLACIWERMEQSFHTCWYIHILLDEIISVLLHFKVGFVLLWNRTVISAVCCCGPRALGRNSFYTQFQTGESDVYKLLSKLQLGRVTGTCVFRDTQSFELLVFWIKYSKYKINKHLKSLSTVLYQPYNSSLRIFFSFIY